MSLVLNGFVEKKDMSSTTNLGPMISGFGVCLFAALACLLRWKYRRELFRQERMDKGLRSFVSTNSQEEEAA
jgi:hypothetical protein